MQVEPRLRVYLKAENLREILAFAGGLLWNRRLLEQADNTRGTRRCAETLTGRCFKNNFSLVDGRV